MKSKDQTSSFKIILIGNLIVNFPVLLIIFSIVIIALYLNFSWNFGLIAGIVLGWFLWGRLLKVWKKWALNLGVEKERLYELGKRGLLNFSKNKIFEE